MEKEKSIVAVLVGNKIIYKSEELSFSEKDLLKYSKTNILTINNQLYIEKLGKNANNEDILLVIKRNYPEYKYKIQKFEHDIREPLKNISNFLTLIEKSILSGNIEQIKAYISFAIDSVKILNDFSKGLLNEKTEKQDVDFKNIISNIISLDKTQFEKYNVEILFDNNIPKLGVDYSDLISLFKNLIENSIKYSSNKKIIITIKVKSIHSDFIIISFYDNSVLNDNDITNIESILRGRKKFEKSIGLIICKNIVKKYGGKLELNRGNKTFSYNITLPLWRDKYHENS